MTVIAQHSKIRVEIRDDRQATLDRENLIEARAELSTLDAYARTLGYASALDALVTLALVKRVTA